MIADRIGFGWLRAWQVRLGLISGVLGAIILMSGVAVWAFVTDLNVAKGLHDPQAEHADQLELLNLVMAGNSAHAFAAAFGLGDLLFKTTFNALDGIGANVGPGQRFTRVPRADLAGSDQWANHFPPRETGPNAQSCNACHNQPSDDGAGGAVANVHRDPFHQARLDSFILRNTPHLFGVGAVQVLAEEMTEELHGTRDSAQREACETRKSVSKNLSAKGIDFGAIKVIPNRDSRGRGDNGKDPRDRADEPILDCKTRVDTSKVAGIDPDLVVRPLQWKGNVGFVRDFNRGASHNEIGMQAVEIVGDGVDGDFDGIVNEMTIGDQTALAVYLAAQPRPTTRIELASLGLIGPLSPQEVNAINQGAGVFERAGCAVCHTPAIKIKDPVFSEPSQNPFYRDKVFPAGQNPMELGVDPSHPITFDLTEDQPDNRIPDGNGNIFLLGALEKDGDGAGIIRLYGDLKRHRMGQGLSETIDEVGTGRSVFLTENLWGVGSTSPYLHDGRATTLTEAILDHGGEADPARTAFLGLESADQQSLIAFLENLVLFKLQ